MRYLSLFSGIEAASVAFEPLGWQAVAFSEIDPFACAVLAHRFPDVPNWGDVTKYESWPDESIELICGGSPCQSFSIAGLRKGLDDERGNLMLTFGHVLAKYRPSWFIWENVPGVLSSDDGRDFASFLGLVTGQVIEPPEDGWRNTGAISGIDSAYGIAYRVLDAQYTRSPNHPRAVPQRRRRVFVVGHLGDWRRAAAVLLDSESLSRNPAPRRETGEGTPKSVENSARKCSVSACERVAEKRGWCNTHYQRWRKSGDVGNSPVHELGRPDSERFWESVEKTNTCWNYTGSLNEKGYGIYWRGSEQRLVRAHRFAFEEIIGEIPDGLHLDHLCRNRRCCNPSHLEPVTPQENTRRGNAGKHWADKRGYPDPSDGNGGGLIAADVSPCVTNGPPFSRTGNERIEAEAMVVVKGSHWDGSAHPPLTQSHSSSGIAMSDQELFAQRGAGLVAARQTAFGEYEIDGTASCVQARDYKDATDLVVLGGLQDHQTPRTDGVSPCLPSAMGEGGGHTLIIAIRTAQTSANGHGLAEEVAHTLDGANGQVVASLALPQREGKAGGGKGPLVFDEHTGTLATNNDQAVMTPQMAVRRLTPRECERLQAFSDNWTHIPWRIYKEAERKGVSYESLLLELGIHLREPAGEECPDGPRYKAIGNSMATPCMEVIGIRIEMVTKGQLSTPSPTTETTKGKARTK